MQRRQITLADGRYLIFYTFEERAPTRDERGDAGPRAEESAPARGRQAEEERRV